MTKVSGLGALKPQEFLRKYWQKKPLFIKGAFPGHPQISRDFLISLAAKESVVARIVSHRLKKKWKLEHGPFTKKSFLNRDSKNWTLLVQEVNYHLPLAQRILDAYSFIPAWRVDDLMVSYAAPGGTVGPHIDQYDVFLIQASGSRKWEISTRQDFSLIPNIDLKVIADFSPQKVWVAKPGDVLYLPPGVAHYGTALDDCVTLSVGFRAPSATSIIDAAFSAVSGEGPLMADSERKVCINRGEVKPEDFSCMKELMGEIFDEPEVQQALVDLLTRERRETTRGLPISKWTVGKIKNVLSTKEFIVRNPRHRLAFVEQGNGIYVALNGRGQIVKSKKVSDLYRILSNNPNLSVKVLKKFLENKECGEILSSLFSAGFFQIDNT